MADDKQKVISNNSIEVSENKLPSIAIAGAGALGSFYGALLQKNGHSVQFQSRSSYKVLSHSPLNIKSAWGDFQIKAAFFETAKEMHKADIVMVTCKALPGIDYKTLLESVVGRNSTIIVLQNGINNDEKIQSIFPDNKVYAATAFSCINRLAADQIHHLDYGNVMMASIGKEQPDEINKLSEYFTSAGIPVKTAEDHRYMRWQKLLWNIPFNSLSVLLHGATTSDMISNEHCMSIVRELLNETREIAKSDGVLISETDAEQMVERTKKMKPYKTSMLLDHEAKKPMEVDAILGEPLIIAKENSVSAISIKNVYSLLSFLNDKST